MEFKKSLRINAPAEKIFMAMSDSTKMSKVMPKKLHEQLIEQNASEFDLSKSYRPDPTNKNIAWGDGGGYKGNLQVQNAGPGSEVIVKVQSENPKATKGEVDKMLNQFLHSLQQQVDSPSGTQRNTRTL